MPVTNTPRSNRTLNALAKLTIAACLAGGAMLSACRSEGGNSWSSDSFTYVSTSWQPKTITLFDTRTGEAIWSVDIPVGKKLNVGFNKGTGPNEYKPDEIVWEVTWGDRLFGTRDNRMPCPPSTARRLEMSLRAAPEMPATDMPGSPFEGQDTGKNTVKTGAAAAVDSAPKSKPVPPVVPVEAPKPAPKMEPPPAPIEPASAPAPAPAEPAKPAEPPVDLPG